MRLIDLPVNERLGKCVTYNPNAREEGFLAKNPNIIYGLVIGSNDYYASVAWTYNDGSVRRYDHALYMTLDFLMVVEDF